MYNLKEKTFDFFSAEEDIKKSIKRIKQENNLSCNIKEKNNMPLFKCMRKNEWEEVVEQNLLVFLRDIIIGS
jgi:hypothetical protein